MSGKCRSALRASETFGTGNDLGDAGDRRRHTTRGAIILAELLLQDAELAESAGQKREALIGRAQAQALIAHNLARLSPEDQAIYGSKLAALSQSEVPSKDR